MQNLRLAYSYHILRAQAQGFTPCANFAAFVRFVAHAVFKG